MKKNVVLLGKGNLSILIAAWFKESSKFNLKYIVPDLPEPEWAESISTWAQEAKVPIIQTGRYEDLPEDLNIDLAISVFYGKIIKPKFIQRCIKIINLHNSPLPKYRGVRPINWALKNDEKQHGVTIHKITKGIDEGNILGQIIYPIYPRVEEVQDVYKKSQEYGWLLFKDVMANFEEAYKYSQKQTNGSSYYSNKDSEKLGERSGWTR